MYQNTLSPTLSTLREQAKAVALLVHSDFAKRWLKGTDRLPEPSPRTLYRSSKWLSKYDYEALSSDEKAKVKTTAVDAELYYNTKYGTPIAYAAPVELAAKFGLKDLSGGKVMDFGYGGIGQLRLFAEMGAEAVGVDVDPFLTTLYSLPEDTGPYGKGSVRLVQGQFPLDAAVVGAVGGGYDVIVSKNTLKRGYIHPGRPADKRQLIDLGVSDEVFLKAVFTALKPGGLLIIYNLCPAPAPADKPYIPWAEGQSPFTRSQFEKVGLRVLAFDVKDDEPVRKMAHALGWDRGDQPMDIKKDLFAWYTVVRRPSH